MCSHQSSCKTGAINHSANSPLLDLQALDGTRCVTLVSVASQTPVIEGDRCPPL